MKSYQLKSDSGIDALAPVEGPAPRPGPRQVLVRVRATSLNYRDLMIALGRYPVGRPKFPLRPLSDGAGEVVELGSQVQHLKIGDRVASAFFQKWIEGPFDREKAESALGGAIDGVLAEYVVLEADAALKIPDHLTYEEAATLPCAGVTAWVGLMELGRLRAGETVLAMGTGGVSVFALQLAKLAGARVVLTSSSDDKLARGRALGADATINYRATPDWAARVLELTDGRGVDHVLEVGGATTLAASTRAVRPGGHVTLVGVLGGAMADREAAQSSGRDLRVDSVYVGSVRHFQALNDAVARGAMHPVVDRVLPFEEAPDAYRFLQSGAHFGKVVVRV